MSRKGPMALGAFLMAGGHHIAAWRHPQATGRAGADLAHFVHLARMSEAAGFDLIFLEDAAAIREKNPDIASQAARSTHFEPLSLLAALATATSHIGLVSTASTSYNEPEALARSLATIDHLSGGRAGWNLVTSASALEAANFAATGLRPHAERYQHAESFIDRAMVWWNANDRPHPVIVQAGTSEAGRQLAARTAELVFTAGQTTADGRDYAGDLKDRLASFGRSRDALRIMPGICPYVGETVEEAQANYSQLQDLIPDAVGMALLGSYLDVPEIADLSPDQLLPDLPASEGMQSRRQLIVDQGRRENLTVRELARRFAGARGHWQVIGTPAQIADAMQERFEAGAADGFNVMAPFFPGGLADFIRLVLPELRRRGLARDGYRSSRLRDNLGLASGASQP